ncbi:MAG: cyclase family protein [Candidatus Acidiferrales bacterium]|jgi:arylformamidase
MTIHDISLPLHTASPRWPGKSPLTLQLIRSLSRGDACTSRSFGMDIHLGTHIDAPAHFIRDGDTIDRVPLATMVGPCRVIEFTGPPGSEIPADIVARQRAERVLFKTQNSEMLSRTTFEPHFVSLSEALAYVLVRERLRLVGIDYFSVDRFESPNSAVHHILLQAGVLILEGINLSGIEPGDYQLLALPLNIVGAEGSPVRAVLVK